MKVDTEHIHHWMQAIRNSPDPIRTMDAFWRGQVLSKEWLIEKLEEILSEHSSMDVEIHGGWVGLLASLLFQSNIKIKKITNIDIDPICENIASTMNQIELEQGRFKAITADMCQTPSTADIVINTSCEHITQQQYEDWLLGIPKASLLVLQSNNYKIPEHIRTAENLKEFEKQCNIKVVWSGQLETHLYTRYMVIGNV